MRRTSPAAAEPPFIAASDIFFSMQLVLGFSQTWRVACEQKEIRLLAATTYLVLPSVLFLSVLLALPRPLPFFWRAGEWATFAHFSPHFLIRGPGFVGDAPKSCVKSMQKLPNCPLTGHPCATSSIVGLIAMRKATRREVLTLVWYRKQIWSVDCDAVRVCTKLAFGFLFSRGTSEIIDSICSSVSCTPPARISSATFPCRTYRLLP